MDQTELLPPICAVRLTWAQTGAFAKDVKSSNDIANMAKQELDSMAKKGAESTDEDERHYVREVMHVMLCSMRNLDVIYKERELNFGQNRELRSVALKLAQEYKQFGTKFSDFIKSIPSIPVVVTTGGAVTVSAYWQDKAFDWRMVLGVAVIAMGTGLLAQFLAVRWAGQRHMDNCVRLDYERGLYYLQYLERVRKILKSLYERVYQLHETYLGQKYPLPRDADAGRIIDDVMVGLEPLQCPHIHKHMAPRCVVRWRIQPDLWARCDAGGDAAKECQHYPKQEQMAPTPTTSGKQ